MDGRGQVLSCLTEVRSYRQYEAWRGNNTFWCKGRVMLGSDAKFFVFTNFFLVVPAVVFAVLVVPLLHHPHVEVALWVITALGTLVCLYYLWMSAITEPGILLAQPTYIATEPPQGAETGMYG